MNAIQDMLRSLGFLKRDRRWSIGTPRGRLTVQEIQAPLGGVYVICWTRESTYLNRMSLTLTDAQAAEFLANPNEFMRSITREIASVIPNLEASDVSSSNRN